MGKIDESELALGYPNIKKGTRLFHFKNDWFVSIVSDDNHNNIFTFDHVQVIMVVGVS